MDSDVILDVSGFVLRKLFSVLPVTTEIINASFKTVVQVQNVVKRHLDSPPFFIRDRKNGGLLVV